MPLELPRALILLSPHRDDAAFSMGGLLLLAAAIERPLTVLNLFTVSSYAPFGEEGLSTEAVSAMRRAEDDAVVSRLSPSISLLDLALLDAPLRLHIGDDQVVSGPLTPEQLITQVEHTRAALPAVVQDAMLLVPLALGAHIDHIITRDAGISTVPANRIGFYQDLPYASRIHSDAMLDEETAGILANLSARTRVTIDPHLLQTASHIDGKRQLVACYPSQVAPETMNEIADWTQTLGGERLYLSREAADHLASLLPGARLERLQEERP